MTDIEKLKKQISTQKKILDIFGKGIVQKKEREKKLEVLIDELETLNERLAEENKKLRWKLGYKIGEELDF